MAVARAAALLALLALATPALAHEELGAALAADDACQGDDATCSVELRQLRALEKTEKAEPAKAVPVKAHEHAEAKAAEAKATVAPKEKVAAVQANATKKRTGACSAADEAIMSTLGSGHGSGSFPKVVADCGHGAYSFWSGFSQSKLSSCVSSETGLSASCAACFGDAGQYGYSNCKLQCLFGSWCSDSCLGCTESNDATVNTCTGDITLPKATEC